ncbi:carbohydrate kinase [uncultured Cocleimonas sp.]|uniref:carbohydrate kinase family protein n=1 Tax=uncultured Cocleimonas sp. TaxID=1051587 RepID=UPI00263042D1|nr:carbohydrate kinase [uncultured Cocleimonas sp.]
MFVICGEALIDIFVEDNQRPPAESFPMQACVGGSPFNVAIGLARLGQSAALFTGISNDMFGKRLSTVLEEENVSQELIVKKSLPTTVAFVEKDKNGVPTYSFYGEGTADRSITSDDINFDIDDPIAIHLGSYSIVSQPTADSLLSLVKKYSGKCLISLDPNIRAIVEPDMKVWQNRVDELVSLADIVKVSDEDLELMYPDTAPEEIIQKWLATGLKLIVLTRGGEGSSLWSAQAHTNLETPKIKVIDTVGAGDTYQAALLDSVGGLFAQYGNDWSEQLDENKLKEIGNFSAAAAAITCSRQGADLPTKTEVLNFI